MDKREKILQCLNCCMPVKDTEPELTCEDCPYSEKCLNDPKWATVIVPVEMIEDVRQLLEAMSA